METTSINPESLDIQTMPMPTDSQAGLQEFARLQTENGNSDVEDDKNEVPTEGWYQRYFRWVPTSPILLEQAEKKILSYVKTKYEGRYVDIKQDGNTNNCMLSKLWGKKEDTKVWTLVFNKDSDKLPLVLIHGLCSAVGLWALNVDSWASERPVYAIDLIGFGRSSRPKFSSDPIIAEQQHVEAIEEWRKEIKLERFILLGHSMGGFISTAYALKYPDRVVHLVLADPWGFPQKPENLDEIIPAKVQNSFRYKAITTIGQCVNPLSLLRASGPFGPGFINRFRPDLAMKFDALNQNGSASIGEYLFHSNAQNPTGEGAFRTMMNFFAFAKHPMCNRLHELDSNIALTVIYGEKTWLKTLDAETLKALRPPEALTQVHILEGAGHHVYVDSQSTFNSLVNKVAELADKIFNPTKVMYQ